MAKIRKMQIQIQQVGTKFLLFLTNVRTKPPPVSKTILGILGSYVITEDLDVDPINTE